MSSSSSTAGPPDDAGADIEAALADYWQRLDREGRQFTAEIRQQMLAAHPLLASALQTFFGAEDAVAPGDAASAESQPTVIRYVGDYEVLHLLGEGGMGAVYAARQQSTGALSPSTTGR